MIGDKQIFGTDPILKTVEPVKMIHKLPRSCQENGHDPTQCLEPEGPAFSGETQ